ncbi:molybdenum cofactor biosynthesis protein MoaE [Hippea maritima]|uniref:Molybdopterin synthase catalytic subunit n=1 Tax=Hippea maritima (strain ATCC 700847 / DSM 10411 / MH2) TaxID=760142 RepID=F2LWU7_HIPMA|nr:molybdenum cofactor biosynthesis protein MoaE [Hippea maritima]AEA33075.1 molybdopterin converting factor, subunit 2 [Hippea maritima DSM 10411]
MFDLNNELKKIKEESNKGNLGMILVHNGVVRATSKNGKPIKQMIVSYDEKKLDELIERINALDYIEKSIIWINKGKLNIGDDIMYVIMAGNRRKDLLPLFEQTIETIKNEIVKEAEE